MFSEKRVIVVFGIAMFILGGYITILMPSDPNLIFYGIDLIKFIGACSLISGTLFMFNSKALMRRR